jgi:hypothetical protein
MEIWLVLVPLKVRKDQALKAAIKVAERKITIYPWLWVDS